VEIPWLRLITKDVRRKESTTPRYNRLYGNYAVSVPSAKIHVALFKVPSHSHPLSRYQSLRYRCESNSCFPKTPIVRFCLNVRRSKQVQRFVLQCPKYLPIHTPGRDSCRALSCDSTSCFLKTPLVRFFLNLRHSKQPMYDGVFTALIFLPLFFTPCSYFFLASIPASCVLPITNSGLDSAGVTGMRAYHPIRWRFI
jgi:hypothetical protein